jgi:hypothetical protein
MGYINNTGKVAKKSKKNQKVKNLMPTTGKLTPLRFLEIPLTPQMKSVAAIT